MSHLAREMYNENANALETLLLQRFRRIRRVSEALCAPLEIEDYLIQSMPDVSPPKWHLAHVTWFFEAFVLKPFLPGYQTPDPAYDYFFNSYYETHGTPFPRAQRGLISRPTVADVYRFRAYVDEAMEALLMHLPEENAEEIVRRTELGLNHEQQHQELLLMDIKHILAQNPLHPCYRSDLATPAAAVAPVAPLRWHAYPGGVCQIGADGSEFAFDCETPRHRVYLEPFQLASRLVTNGEYLAFIEDQGYARSNLWLSDGFALLRKNGWQAPLYWEKVDGSWYHMTLSGLQPIDEQAPVCHVSFYEAEAYASWAGARLPSEAEWELAAARLQPTGNFMENDYLRPVACDMLADTSPQQMFGDVWEWTASAYRPYPGFKPLPGSLGEYNGKFMSSQMVLRGGCCATPADHIRATYRNFFYPSMRWQFAGLRLAKEI
ncbi:ergothioneine biosynthesis protein EgtB [Pseudomonas duriflava]|uniref:Ergothioneine biosynthesis protein EgtB n=1 Tax=Pseudomonas duriflava TaxID=459528 RepID=A0A562Q2T2_9PSED|nr:ergothioneine biosynthesis protein EgtB [Pseudomonas duriflava]TWI50974.1 ergothioneine biosynthesis protein EgtB [Pseudomonas duriflava]